MTANAAMKTVYDIGMFDGADTRYYLESGYRVIAVEANPELVAKARAQFADYIQGRALHLVHAAVSQESAQTVTLTLSGEDLGSSTTVEGMNVGHKTIGSFTVSTKSMAELLSDYGPAHFVKVDIEGADRHAVLALSKDNAPAYLSFEAGKDAAELIRHAISIGYTGFKIINQCNFRATHRQGRLLDRLALKLVVLLGFHQPALVKRAGRFFRLGHSSGPAPWDSDGGWLSADEILHAWAMTPDSNEAWYDIHAMRA